MKRILILTAALALLTGSAFAQWKLSEETNGMDNVKTTTAVLSSDNKSDVDLIVRCTGRDLDIYVSTGVVDEEYGVRVKFDDEKPKADYWERATSYSALFSRNAKKLLPRLLTSQKFYIEYHPFHQVETTAAFSVAGLPITSCPVVVTSTAEPQGTGDVKADRKAFLDTINAPGRKGQGTIEGDTLTLSSAQCNQQNFDLLIANPHMQQVFKSLKLKLFIYTNDLDLSFKYEIK